MSLYAKITDDPKGILAILVLSVAIAIPAMIATADAQPSQHDAPVCTETLFDHC
jgi:hypothetical protein